jgi:hypothetical protein
MLYKIPQTLTQVNVLSIFKINHSVNTPKDYTLTYP